LTTPQNICVSILAASVLVLAGAALAEPAMRTAPNELAAASALPEVAQQQQPVAQPYPATGTVLSLDEAVALGENRNLDLARARRSDEIAKLQVDIAKAQYWPQAELTFNLSQTGRADQYYAPQLSGVTAPYATFQGGPTAYVTMPVDLWGTVGRTVRQAKFNVEATHLQVDQSKLDVTTNVRGAYIDALRAQGALDADQAMVDDVAALAARVKSPEIRRFLEVELSNARQALSASVASADIAQSGLKQQLRLPQESHLTLTTKLDPAIPVLARDALLEKALARRTDVQQARIRYKQADLSLKQTDDARKPSIYITAYYNASFSDASPATFWRSESQSAAALVTVTVPLLYFDHGVTKNNRLIARLNRDQAEDDLTAQNERVAIELRQYLIRLDQAQANLRNLPSPALAHEALERAETALAASSSPEQIAQVTNARNSWRLAETASIEALADYYSAYYNLKHALGEE
jgi:outer membrane protein TolC